MTDDADAGSRSDLGPLTWVPLGLWAGGALAVLRSGVQLSLAHRRVAVTSDAEDAIFAWQTAGDYPGLLLQCLIVGLVGGALAHRAALDRARALLLFTAAIFLSALSGWPLAAPRDVSRFHGELTLDDLALVSVLAVVIAALLFALMRHAERGGRMRSLLSGRVAFVLALVLAVLLPAGYAWRRSAEAPSFTLRGVQRDLLAEKAFQVLAQNVALGPAPTVITPAVEQRSDSADKPALWMPPPCTVELRVTPEDGDVVLRAAAGVDKTVRGKMPPGIDRVTVDFRVEVNGAEVFAESVVSERLDPNGEWDPLDWVWHHVGGEEGLALAPGDVVTLHTRIPDGDPGARAPASYLKVGFGGLVLEKQVRRARVRATHGTPNIVLIVMDTLRADRMSCYGCERRTTPHLDRLAERGVLFENALSTSSWTWPSTASILTGLPADAHGVVSNQSCTLNLSLTSLPEVLQWRGYTTAAFSCNPLIARERYFDQGFESFEYPRVAFQMSDEVMPGIVRWLEGHAGARFFLYLHLADPHTPHRPHPAELARLGVEAPDDFPMEGMHYYTTLLNAAREPNPEALVPEDHRRWIHDQYDASVATGDRWLGVFFDALEGLGLAEKTIVAFTADHGEELFDHQMLEHGHTIYGELVHAPLILAGPGIPRGLRVKGVTSNRHLAPTLARLGGAELPGMGDGRFLLDEIAAEEVVFQTVKGRWDGARNEELIGLRSGDWVLHWRSRERPTPEDFRLFDLEGDPNELFDLKGEETERATDMFESLKRQLAAQRAYAPEYRVGVGAGGSKTLSAIGYGNGDDEDEEPEDDR